MPRLSKKLALLLVLAMMATMFIGMGTVSAATTNLVTSTPVVKDGQTTTLGSIWAYENSDQAGSVFAGNTIYATVTILTSDVTFSGTVDNSVTYMKSHGPTALGGLTIVGTPTDKTYTVEITGPAAGQAGVEFNFPVTLSGAASGPVEVQIDAPNSGMSSGKYTIGSVAGKGTVASVLDTSTVKIGTDNQTCGLVRIQDAVTGSLTAGDVIHFDLPTNVTWNAATSYSVSGCTVSGTAITESASGFSRLDVTIGSAATGTQIGMITITPKVDVDDDAAAGDITVSISGSNSDITSASAVIGTAGDYSATVTAAGDPTTIYAGELDQKMQDFRIKEAVAGSLLGNRTVLITLPSYVHWFSGTTPDITYEKGDSATFEGTTAEVTKDDDRNTKKLTIKDGGSDSAVTALFGNLKVYVDPDAPEGDVTVTFSGTAGLDDTSAVLATVAKPITATGGSNELIIGQGNQPASDLVIEEVAASLIKANPTTIKHETGKPDKDSVTTNAADTGEIIIDAPSGVTFANTPTVTVDGNLKLKASSVSLINNDNSVEIDVDTSSTAAAKITVSDINLTIDRTVPVGDLVLSIGGNSIDRTSKGDTNTISEFQAVAKAAVGKVVTPAPTEKSHVSVFTIGATNFTVDGVDQTLDAAPYIKDGRTFLPIAYVANAMGISGSNILWDGVNQTVTLMKGDKVVQLKIGSNTLLINGAAVAMDVAPEISNSRTCLPVSLVANAFGFTASWDAATQTVTIQ